MIIRVGRDPGSSRRLEYFQTVLIPGSRGRTVLAVIGFFQLS